MSKVLQSLPVGERVGIAFSGGLDTSVAVAWMRDKGAIPCTYTADLGQPDEARHRRRSPVARSSTAPRSRASSTARPPSSKRASSPSPCGAFHIRSGGKTYFNTTPLGRAVTGTMLVRAMKEDGVDIWGDGSTYKGNDIERFYRYGLLANPRLRIYKPWLDADFVTELGGRTEMSEWLVAHGFPYRDTRREGVLDRRQHLGRHARGQDPRAPRTSRSRSSSRSWASRFWDPDVADRDRRRHVTLRGRPPGRHSTASSTPTRSRSSSRRTRIGGRHGLGMSDQIENRIIEAKSRGIYEAPGMALLHIAYERLVNGIHNEDTLANYHEQGRRLGRLMYEGRWLDPQSLMLRESIQKWVGSAVTGAVTAAPAPRRRLHDPRHHGPEPLATPRTSSRWSASATPPSARPTASASSRCATSTSPTRARASSSTPAWASSAARPATSSAASPRAKPTRSPSTPTPYDAAREALADAVDEASESAAFDFGSRLTRRRRCRGH